MVALMFGRRQLTRNIFPQWPGVAWIRPSRPGFHPFTYVPSTLLSCLHSRIIFNVMSSSLCFFTLAIRLHIFFKCSSSALSRLVFLFLPTGRPCDLSNACTCCVDVGRKGSSLH